MEKVVNLNYAIFILVPNIYNPTLNIKVVLCMKRYIQTIKPHYVSTRVG